jgi:hypothetical protein
MQGRVIGGITPQNKMVAVNNRFGNTNIKGQQGTTRVLFDSILLNGATELRFFENSGSKNYPFTNIGSEGNRLNVGDTFVVQKIYFATFEFDPDTQTVFNFQYGLGAAADLWKGELSMQIANSQVIKQLPTTMFEFTDANPTGVNGTDVAFETFTDIVIPPLLEYVVTLRTANNIPPQTPVYAVCFLEGSAGIISPQTTF